MLMGMLLNSMISLLVLSARTPETIAPGLIICVSPEILKQTKLGQVEAV